MPGLHAGPLAQLSQISASTAGGYQVPRAIVLLAIAGVALIIVLTIPVLSDKLTAFLSAKGSKAAPPTFLIGLAILLTGLGSGVRVLMIGGGCLIGLVLLGALLDNY